MAHELPPEPTARRARAKLSPRLSMLLSMGHEELRALQQHERKELQKTLEALAALHARAEGESEEARRSARESRFELAGRLFAPITAGWHFPEEARDLDRVPDNEPFMSAFIVADLAVEDLEALGARVRTQAGHVATAFVPVSRIAALEACPRIEMVELANAVLPHLDEAIPLGEIDQLHGSNVNGAGTIVGVIDTVLDIFHRDFRQPNGATRVRYLWDQSLVATAGEAAPAAGYGVRYDQAQIDAQLNAPNTPYGNVRHNAAGKVGAHGTSVAGVAAGFPHVLPANYIGAAPRAEIIFVAHRIRNNQLMADMADVADGFEFIFGHADKPCVVNLSNGDNLGPHDGWSPIEQYIDSLLEIPGRAVVLSAGNSNGFGSHTSGSLNAAGMAKLQLSYVFPTNTDTVEIWYDGADRFDIKVTFPAAFLGGIAVTVQPGQEMTVNGCTISSRLNHPGNGDNYIVLLFTAAPPHGTIDMDLSASAGTGVIVGTYHAWVDRSNRGSSRFLNAVEDSVTLGRPGTARRAITVGNHDKQRAIAPSSGRGPTRDGRVKPDLAATGTDVTSAQSVNRATTATNPYLAFTGTSASAPLVAGACACLLQCRGGGLSSEQLKQVLIATAGTAGLAFPDNGFGNGYLQIGSGCHAARPVDLWLRDALDDDGQEPYAGPVAWRSPDIGLFDLAGAVIDQPAARADGAVSAVVRVTVRNRGDQPAVNSEVYLYWADPATHIPYPSGWNASGIFTGTGFSAAANMVAIPMLAPNASTTVEFGWAPPAPGANVRGDDHFCLIARIENAADHSGVVTGGWDAVTRSNNIALRNVHVREYEDGSEVQSRFHVVGTDDRDSLELIPEHALRKLVLVLPAGVLPWRDPGNPPEPPYLKGDTRAAVRRPSNARLDARETRRRTRIEGATGATIAQGIATVTMDEPKTLRIPELLLAPRSRVQLRLNVTPLRTADAARVHVAQRSGGTLVGGVTLELRRRN